jgi:hypothetical protein
VITPIVIETRRNSNPVGNATPKRARHTSDRIGRARRMMDTAAPTGLLVTVLPTPGVHISEARNSPRRSQSSRWQARRDGSHDGMLGRMMPDAISVERGPSDDAVLTTRPAGARTTGVPSHDAPCDRNARLASVSCASQSQMVLTFGGLPLL